MPKPTKAEMIKELLCLSDYDYAMATHGDGALIHSDIAALVCMSDGDDRCLKELGDQALAPFDVGTLAAAVIGQENAREAAAALGYGECFDELFANQKLAFEEHFETLRARNRELEQMSAKDVAIIHKKGMAAQQRRLEEERLAEEERRFAVEEQQRLEDEQQLLAEEEQQRFYNLDENLADLGHYAKMSWLTLEQAVAVSLGKDPAIVNWDAICEYKDRSEFVREYDRRRQLLVQSDELEALGDKITPGNLILWAERLELSLPTNFQHSVAKYHKNQEESVAAGDARILQLERELNRRSQLSTRETNKLLQMFYCALKVLYEEEKNVCMRFERDSRVAKLPADHQTIEKYFNMAKDCLPGEYLRKSGDL